MAHLDMGSHTGTHVDAPAHTVAGGRTMADVSLDELVGEALVLRVSEASRRRGGWDARGADGRCPSGCRASSSSTPGGRGGSARERALRHPSVSSGCRARAVRPGDAGARRGHAEPRPDERRRRRSPCTRSCSAATG